MFLVVGGGIAGVSCTEQLALSCPEKSIVLISGSALVKSCINVKSIAKVLQDFDVEERDASYLETQYPNVQVIHSLVVALDCETQKVRLSNGRSLQFEKLCLCTGGKPKLIYKDNSFVIGIRDTETVKVLQEKLVHCRRILVVGNGGIATELVHEIESCQVIWAIRDKSIGATFFDAGAAEFFLPHLCNRQEPGTKPVKRLKYNLSEPRDLHESNRVLGSALGPDWSTGLQIRGEAKNRKIHIEYECEVQQIYSSEEISKNEMVVSELEDEESCGSWHIYVKLTNGKVYGCDVVISATGVDPNTEHILHGNKFNVASDGGLLVDTQMRTSHSNVYAAGDVCTTSWEPSHNWLQMRLWTQARQMGMYAAQCMCTNSLGSDNIMDICFDIFTHVTRFFGFKVVLLGLYNCQKLGTDCELLIRMTKGQEYLKIVLQNGRVQGAVLIGDTDLEETFENLILNQLDVSSLADDLLNPNIDIEDYFD